MDCTDCLYMLLWEYIFGCDNMQLIPWMLCRMFELHVTGIIIWKMVYIPTPWVIASDNSWQFGVDRFSVRSCLKKFILYFIYFYYSFQLIFFQLIGLLIWGELIFQAVYWTTEIQNWFP